MKIKELYTDESKWIKTTLSLDGDKNFVFPCHEKAVCWCLLGAIEKCYSKIEDKEEVQIKIRKKINNDSIAHWNDSDVRKFEEVKALIEELDI